MEDNEPRSNTPDRRAMCARCERPVRVCYCAALPSIETRSRIVILQHPREQGRPIGTAHMARLCLPQAQLHVGISWDESEILREACGDPARPPVLLYPGPEARDILRDPPSAPVTLLVVDGTWSQARATIRDNPELAALPRYAFDAPAPSTYRIRPEPSPERVSTIEALMYALGAIEGDPARFRAMLAPLAAMVDGQLAAEHAAMADGTSRTKLRQRRSPYERLPEPIRTSYDELVLVVADANAWPHRTLERELGDELVYWVALRPSTDASFSFVLAPRLPLAPRVPGHIELSADALEAGGTVEAFHEAFAAFLRPSDIVCSWGHHALRLFRSSGGAMTVPYLDLQDAARLLTNTNPGPLDRFAATLDAGHELRTPPCLPPGRAGRRLGALAHILASWRALPGSPGTELPQRSIERP